MPLYVFENQQHGLRAEIPFSVDERPDTIVLVRKTVPDSVAIAGSATSTFDRLKDPLHGYKRLEERGQLDTRSRGQLLSDNQRKAAAAMPIPT